MKKWWLKTNSKLRLKHSHFVPWRLWLYSWFQVVFWSVNIIFFCFHQEVQQAYRPASMWRCVCGVDRNKSCPGVCVAVWKQTTVLHRAADEMVLLLLLRQKRHLIEHFPSSRSLRLLNLTTASSGPSFGHGFQNVDAVPLSLWTTGLL